MLVLLLIHPNNENTYREKCITVVQSLHTPPNPHGPSSGKQQGGCTETAIYYCNLKVCDGTGSNI